MKKVYFCPNCQRKIDLPSFFKGEIKLGPEAKIKVNCGNCNKDGKGNPKGFVTIKQEKSKELIK